MDVEILFVPSQANLVCVVIEVSVETWGCKQRLYCSSVNNW